MSYFELKDNDVFINTIEANPDYFFYIHSGSVYLNNHQHDDGNRDATALGVDPGHISLFEYNVDRPLSERIYPFITKSGNKESFKTVSKTSWNTQYNYDGQVITGSYNLSASISRETMSSPSSKLRALRSALNHYHFWSLSFDYNNYQSDVTMINIPSIFYGSSLKKGQVNLKMYLEGQLVAEATDESRKGELVSNDVVIGTVLYDEGILLLTGSSTISQYGTNQTRDLRWVDFGEHMFDTSNMDTDHLSASFGLNIQGVSQIQNMTILAKAPEGMLNHSNNPTYLQADVKPLEQYHTSSYEYIEKNRKVKNVVHTEQAIGEPPFQKETYISKICIYDKHRRLIGVCKLATPMRKSEAKEYLFKMKIDL
tara:strand:+ start:333 stop:1439 length:1107 start_codon:yes stop_codon:yes gene_type:complete